jgi:hypothetical protein
MGFGLTKNQVPQHTKSLLLNCSSTESELQLGRLSGSLEDRVDNVEHLFARLVLVAKLLAILETTAGERKVDGLKDLLETTAPEGAAVCVYGVVGGLADEAEGGKVFVVFEVGGDALVELCKEYQYALRSIGAMAEGENLTSMGMASKPFEAMLSALEIVCCGVGM